MFGKIYFLGLGLVLLASGTAFSLAAGMASGPCGRLSSLPAGFDVAFNPCSLFSSLPGVGLLMQAVGAVVLAAALFFVARSSRKIFLECPNCKRRLRERSAFCPNCGAKLPAPDAKK